MTDPTGYVEHFEYATATDLNYAWLNFELDLPLEVIPDGRPNPFYVDRPGNPVAALERALLRPFRQLPKYFFSGHRGCGKSTELRRLAANKAILARFWPVRFTIQDEADIDNIDYQDVLLAIGGQMYRQYRLQGGRLPKQLLKELDGFRGKVEREVIISPRLKDSEIAGELDAFFARAALKIKLEPHTRHIVRQVIENDITGLIELINLIATAIRNAGGRWPLILIDDLDKPDLARARSIFYDHRRQVLQPNCAIVYTVSSPLFYSPEFAAIQERAIFLPNVKLHERRAPDDRDSEGYRTLRMFVHKRMHPDLIAKDGLNRAITASGGVFREMCRVMRYAIDRAQAAERDQIVAEDVEWAEAEIRNDYRRVLTAEQRELLRRVRATNELDCPDELAPLLQGLAVLEYRNKSNWCDIHPVLNVLLDEEEGVTKSTATQDEGP